MVLVDNRLNNECLKIQKKFGQNFRTLFNFKFSFPTIVLR